MGLSSVRMRKPFSARESYSTITPPLTLFSSAGWSCSTPLSTTATRTPAPVLRPHAQRGVISANGPFVTSCWMASGVKLWDQAGLSCSSAMDLPEAALGGGAAIFCEDFQHADAGPALLLAQPGDLAEQAGQREQLGDAAA